MGIRIVPDSVHKGKIPWGEVPWGEVLCDYTGRETRPMAP